MHTRKINLTRSRDPKMRVLEAVLYFQRRFGGHIPSFNQIAERAGVSPRVVPDYLRMLEQDGSVKRPEKHSSRAP